MKIIAISDIHGNMNIYNNLKKYNEDMLIVAGDLSNLGKQYEMDKYLSIIDELNFKHKILILGNHEVFCDYQYCREKFPNIIFLDNEIVKIEGINIYGTPYCKRFGAWNFPYDTEEECIEKTIPKEKVDIIVCHEPPSHNNLSIIWGGEDIGNFKLREYLENNKDTKLLISGHVHECGGGYTKINNTDCYNVAQHIREINI